MRMSVRRYNRMVDRINLVMKVVLGILIAAMLVLIVLFVARGFKENEEYYQTRIRHSELINRYAADGYDLDW